MSILKIRWWQAFPYKWSNSCLQIGVLKAKLIIFSTELRDAFWLSNIVWAIPGTQKSNSINGLVPQNPLDKNHPACEGGSHLVRWPLRGAKKHPSGFVPSIWPKNVKLWLVISDRWPPKMGLQFDKPSRSPSKSEMCGLQLLISCVFDSWWCFFSRLLKEPAAFVWFLKLWCRIENIIPPNGQNHLGPKRWFVEKLRNWSTRNPGFTHQVCELGSLSPFIYRVSVTSQVVVNAGLQPSTKRSSEHWLGKAFPKLLKFLPAIWFIGSHPESSDLTHIPTV